VESLAVAAGFGPHAAQVQARTLGHALSVVASLQALASGSSGIPQDVAAAVAAQLVRLDQETAEIARGAAVLGTWVDPQVLARLVELLESHDVRYVIGGANALSLYVDPRMTVDVDAFVDASRKDELDGLFGGEFELVRIGRFHSKFRRDGVDIDILYAGARAEDFALANPQDAVILGTKVKAASPEALLWLYLVSTKEQNAFDALNLIRSRPNLDLPGVRKQIERYQPELIGKLEKMLTTARQPLASYEESRSQRQ
jgi:hypothetical protein